MTVLREECEIRARTGGFLLVGHKPTGETSLVSCFQGNKRITEEEMFEVAVKDFEHRFADRKTRKFKEGDSVAITHDCYNAFPKGTIGTIKSCGCRHVGIWQYIVRFNNRDVIAVREDELEKVNDNAL